MIVKVEATRDFTVGPRYEVVIKKGETRIVVVDSNGYFSTITNEGHFFGMCHIDEGWIEKERIS